MSEGSYITTLIGRTWLRASCIIMESLRRDASRLRRDIFEGSHCLSRVDSQRVTGTDATIWVSYQCTQLSFATFSACPDMSLAILPTRASGWGQMNTPNGALNQVHDCCARFALASLLYVASGGCSLGLPGNDCRVHWPAQTLQTVKIDRCFKT